MAQNKQMKGLVNFIADIRKCKNRDEEKVRVEKELSNIKAKCTGGGATKLDPYNRKKYAWKMLLIHMLNYDVPIHGGELAETVKMFHSMVASNNYHEKAVGYMACGVFMEDQPDLLRMITGTIKADLLCGKEEVASLALTVIVNVGGEELAENVAPEVFKLLVDETSSPFIVKKAALCLLHLLRKAPDTVHEDLRRVTDLLKKHHEHPGVLVSVTGLLLGLVQNAHSKGDVSKYTSVVQECADILRMLVLNPPKSLAPWGYFHTYSPWLQIKCFKILQLFPPATDVALNAQIKDVVKALFDKVRVTSNASKNNADHGVLFEAIYTVLHYAGTGQGGWSQLGEVAVAKITTFIAVKSANMRYVSCAAARHFLRHPGYGPIKEELARLVLSQLRSTDTAIRSQAAAVVFELVDNKNGAELVGSLLDALEVERSLAAEEATFEEMRSQEREKRGEDEPAEESKAGGEGAGAGAGAGAEGDGIKAMAAAHLKKQHDLSRKQLASGHEPFDYVLQEKFALSRMATAAALKLAFDLKAAPLDWLLEKVYKRLAAINGDYVAPDVWHAFCYHVGAHAEASDQAVRAALECLGAGGTKDHGIRGSAFLLFQQAEKLGDRKADAVAALTRMLNPELSSGPTRSVVIAALKRIGDAAGIAAAEGMRAFDKPEVAKEFEANVAAQRKYRGHETAFAQYSGLPVGYYLKHFDEFDRDANSKKVAPPPPSSPPPTAAEAGAAAAASGSAHWDEFQTWLKGVQALTKANFLPTWRKIQYGIKRAEGKLVRSSSDDVVADAVASDDAPDVYQLPTGEHIEVDPAAKQSILADENNNADAFDMEAVAPGQPREQWVDFTQ